MTTLDLDFVVNRGESSCRVLGLKQPITSSLASNVNFVTFAKGQGQVFYNDRPPLPELFSDPSPYQSYVNAWITAAAAATPALTLAQAQAIKCAFVDAIYGFKRVAPVSATVTAGTYSFDASNNALTGLAYLAPLNTVITGVNAVITAFDTLNGLVNPVGAGVQTALNSLVSGVNSALSALTSAINLAGTAQTPPFSVGSAPTVGSVAGPSTSGTPSNPSALATISPPTLTVVPVGQTSPITLNSADLQAVALAIAAQNASTGSTDATKKAAVNALSTIAAVVAYDATAGW